MCRFFRRIRFAQSFVRLDVNKLVGGILWERCAASSSVPVCGRRVSKGGWCLSVLWLAGGSEGWCARGEWRCSSGVRCWGPRATAGGQRAAGAGRGSVHSPLTRARGERRSRSVRRLKVARHVTPRVLNPLRPAPRRRAPVCFFSPSRTRKCIVQIYDLCKQMINT